MINEKLPFEPRPSAENNKPISLIGIKGLDKDISDLCPELQGLPKGQLSELATHVQNHILGHSVETSLITNLTNLDVMDVVEGLAIIVSTSQLKSISELQSYLNESMNDLRLQL